MLTHPDGETYSGSFYHHKKHGEGVQKYSDGGCYTGGWIAGMRHGHGVMTSHDGSVYEVMLMFILRCE